MKLRRRNPKEIATSQDDQGEDDPTVVRALRRGEMIDDYELEEVLATSVRSVVARAANVTTGDRVALKIPLSHKGAESIAYETSVHRAVGRRAFIAAMIGSGVLSDGMPYLATDLCGNGTLQDIVEGPSVVRRSQWRDSVRLLGHCAQGIMSLHEAGFVHRDIKPANIGVDSAGTGRVLDLGIAKSLADTTPETKAQGTPGQTIAPEGFLGEVVPASDVWALGAATFFVLTGQAPFAPPRAVTPKEMPKEIFNYYSRLNNGLRDSLVDHNRLLPLELALLVRKMLDPRPDSRPTIEQVYEDYARIGG